MGISYGKISISPFAEETGFFYRRKLVPYLANLTEFSGYLGYFAFSLALAFLLIHLLRAWLGRQGSTLSYWQELSLFSCGIAVYQFQFPGYPETGVFILLMVALLGTWNAPSRAALFALMLLCHETAAVAVLPLLLLACGRREAVLIFALLALYLAAWLQNFGFDPVPAIRAQTLVAGESVGGLIDAYPRRFHWGIFFSLKLLWILIPAGMFALFRDGRKRELAAALSVIFVVFVQIHAGTDTSRLAGFAWLVIPLFLSGLSARVPLGVMRTIFLANVIIPSYFVSVNGGFFLAPGLYRLAIRCVTAIFPALSQAGQ
jgi:hypothetical protein